MSHISLTTPNETGDAATLLLDGQDVSKEIRSVGLHVATGRFNVMVIELAIPTFDVDGEARVIVSPEQEAILTSIGWTPPAVQVSPTGEQQDGLVPDDGAA